MNGCPRSAKTLLGWLALLSLLVLPGCRSEDNRIPDPESQDRIIATAALSDDDSQVEITWFPAPCESFDEVRVDMTDSQARLLVRVTVDVHLCPPQGPAQTLVDLGEPLGDRKIYDVAFGDTVALDQ